MPGRYFTVLEDTPYKPTHSRKTCSNLQLRERIPRCLRRGKRTPFNSREVSPYVNRVKIMWQQMCDIVVKHFPYAPESRVIKTDSKEMPWLHAVIFRHFRPLKKSIRANLEGRNSGEVVDDDHGNWYRELLAPSVTAGILKPSDLTGYRNEPVYIKGSLHTPPNPEAVRDTMPVLSDMLKEESHTGVRAVLDHFVFVYVRFGKGKCRQRYDG